jgi:hypothetical protein
MAAHNGGVSPAAIDEGGQFCSCADSIDECPAEMGSLLLGYLRQTWQGLAAFVRE